MPLNVAKGNAAEDGKDLLHWFVGDIEWWCARDGIPFDASEFLLRNSSTVEMKWTVLEENEERPGGWAPCSDKKSVSILIRGKFIIEFRDPDDFSRKSRFELVNEGDYVIWQGDVEHFWWAEEDTVTLTVRWAERNARSERDTGLIR